MDGESKDDLRVFRLNGDNEETMKIQSKKKNSTPSPMDDFVDYCR